jgi:hypothetical protein
MPSYFTDCALKSGYGLFIVATVIEVFMLILDCIALCMIDSQHGCCRCEHYHLRFIMHFVSCKYGDIYSVQHYVIKFVSDSPDTPISSTIKTDSHDITEILFNVALNIINQHD